MKSFNVQPYSLNNYSIDAIYIIEERLNWLKANPVQREMLSIGILSEALETNNGTPLEPKYAAKWSVIARKRKAGLLLLWLYYVADKHQLDMTIVLAMRMLQGWAGCSISNRTLIEAFGNRNRNASNKSTDWNQVEYLIEKYRESVLIKLHQDRAKQKLIKETLWKNIN